MAEEIEICLDDPANPEVRRIIEAHNAHGDAHYPADSNHHLTAEGLQVEEIILFAARLDGRRLGIAGLKKLDQTTGELKSMHVMEEARGLGVGAKLLEHIISEARQLGLSALYLETGSREASAAARGLYEAFDFSYCPPFGAYKEDVESVFMMLTL
ncbi:MAG: GNAT family N-acetyltransferase [Stappiaceae bacterium]